MDSLIDRQHTGLSVLSGFDPAWVEAVLCFLGH